MARLVFDREPSGTPYDLDGELTAWRLVGSTSYPAQLAGIKGPARTFGGTSGYESDDAGSVHLGLRAVTVRALCRPDFAALAGTTCALVSRGRGGPLAPDYWPWTLRLTVAGEGLSAAVEWAWQDQTGALVVHPIGTVQKPPAGTWLFLSATRETPAGESSMRLSMDGVALGSITAADQIPATPGEVVTLGCRRNGAAYDQLFRGDIELVEVLTEAVTQEQERHRHAELLVLPEEALEAVRGYWFQEPVPLRNSDYERYRLRPLAELQACVEAALLRREEAGLPDRAYAERLAQWEQALGLEDSGRLTLAERQQRAAAAVALAEGFSVPELTDYARRVLGDPSATLIENTSDVLVDLSKVEAGTTRIVAPALEATPLSFTEATGRAIAASGDWILVGDPTATVSSQANAGRVHFYRRDLVANTYAFFATVNNPTPTAGERFGAAVAIDGTLAVIGAPNETQGVATQAGAVYVFSFNGVSWVQQARLVASNPDTDDLFGTSVAISGERLAVGAHQEDSAATGVGGDQADNTASNAGAVYVFARTGLVWSQQAYIKGSNTGAGDRFGGAVALDGEVLVVGAAFEDGAGTGINPADDNAALNSGAAYVFRRVPGAWIQEAYVKASNTNAGDSFGFSVALSGDTVAVGATNEASAATGIDGNQADNTAASSGAVYVFRRTAGVWAQEAYVKASNTAAGDQFGNSVTIRGNELAVGAVSEDDGATSSGAVYLFYRSASWEQKAFLKASPPGTSEQLGAAVALDGHGHVMGGRNGGSAWLLWTGCADAVAGEVPVQRLEALRIEGAITTEWDGAALVVAPACPVADLSFALGQDKAGLAEVGSQGRLFTAVDFEVLASDASRGVGLLYRRMDEAWWLIPFLDAGVPKIRQHRWTLTDGESSSVLGTLPTSAANRWLLIVSRSDAGVWRVRAIGDSDEQTFTLAAQPTGDPEWAGLIVHGTAAGGEPRARVHSLRWLWTEWPISFDWTALAPASTVRPEVGQDLLERRNRASARATYSRVLELVADDEDSWADYTPTVTL